LKKTEKEFKKYHCSKIPIGKVARVATSEMQKEKRDTFNFIPIVTNSKNQPKRTGAKRSGHIIISYHSPQEINKLHSDNRRDKHVSTKGME
jgi:hypothetical protein